MGDLDSRDDDQRRKCIRQKMAEHDARVRECEPARGINIFAPALDQCGAAYGPRVIGPLHANKRDHDFVDALTEDGNQDERDQNGRKRELNIDEAHQGGIDPAAEIGRDHA